MHGRARIDDTGCDAEPETLAASCWRGDRRFWPWSVPEGHAEVTEERTPLIVVGGGGVEGDVHPLRLVDAFVVDLREDDLLPDAERVVAAPVERLGGDPLEVTHAGEREVHQAFEELVHLVAPQGHHGADLLAGA